MARRSEGMETYYGYVRTPPDAIILFEACRLGLLPRVQRRLSEKERQSIKSGSVFVWDEREAGMRRWTDGKSWSASRVSGSFLTYREMEGKRGGNGSAALSGKKTNNQANAKPAEGSSEKGSDGDVEAADEGPDGYRYKPDGLMKQSFSITTSNGQHLHLISYFSRSNSQSLPQPSTDATLRHIRPPKGMYPESTMHEQASSPLVVSRGPMPPGAYAQSPQMAGLPGYARQAGSHPSFVPHPGYWQPSPLQPHPGPPYSPYGYSNEGSPPGSAHMTPSPVAYPRHQYPGHPPQARGPTAFDRAPPPLSNNTLPPPPPVTHMQNGYHHPPPPLQHGYPPPPHYIPNPSPRASQASEMANMRPGGNPVIDPALSNIDPRLSAAPPPPGTPHHPASAPAPPNREHPPAPHHRPRPSQNGPVPETNGNGKLIPSIGALMNPSPPERMPTQNKSEKRKRERSRSPPPPNAHDAASAQDKVGFREDVRALRQLDKAFAA